MEFEEYDIVRLYDQMNYKLIYGAIIRINEDNFRLRLLKQPHYNLISTRHSDRIFKQNCHPDDEVWNMLLNFDKEQFTFDVHKNMCEAVDTEELVDILKHLVFTSFADSDSGKVIITNGIEKLK